MTPRALVVLFGLGLFGATVLALGDEKSKQLAHVTTTEHAKLAPGGAIRIDHSYGDLNIEGWDKPDVEITVIKSLSYGFKRKHPDDATKHLDVVRIAVEAKASSEMAISTIRPHRSGVGVEYRIHAPRDAKLMIRHGTGSVLVSDMLGDIETTCGRGDILLMLRDTGAYSIDAKSKFGTVISDFEGATHLRLYRLGERYTTPNPPAARRIRLRVGFGGISIKAVPSEAYGPDGRN